jgi:hypothetical protein
MEVYSSNEVFIATVTSTEAEVQKLLNGILDS